MKAKDFHALVRSMIESRNPFEANPLYPALLELCKLADDGRSDAEDKEKGLIVYNDLTKVYYYAYVLTAEFVLVSDMDDRLGVMTRVNWDAIVAASTNRRTS